MGKDTIIHNDHKPLQFMQTQGKLKNHHHQKWSMYLQQSHLNIKYKKGRTNHVADFLSRPPVAMLTIVLNSYGHETSVWPRLYRNDFDFVISYQTLNAGKQVTNFHVQDGLLYHLSHICVPSRKHA